MFHNGVILSLTFQMAWSTLTFHVSIISLLGLPHATYLPGTHPTMRRSQHEARNFLLPIEKSSYSPQDEKYNFIYHTLILLHKDQNTLLNQRDEILAKCRHKEAHCLSSVKQQQPPHTVKSMCVGEQMLNFFFHKAYIHHLL